MREVLKELNRAHEELKELMSEPKCESKEHWENIIIWGGCAHCKTLPTKNGN